MILKNADVVLKDRVVRADITVEGGRIAAISPCGNGGKGDVLDCTGLTVFPGLIDIHVHLRDPGFEKKEDIMSGARAAVKGGFTQICCMPNTRPVIDNKVAVTYVKARAKEADLCKIHPIGAITEGQNGENLAAIGAMKQAGAVALSEDGKSVKNAKLMYNAMLYASDFGLKCLCHCEDKDLADGGVVHEGYYSTLTGLKGIPRAAEDVVIARELCLAESLSLPVHICHVSTYSGVELIRAAKRRGVKVTAETCPHYITLTDAAVKDFDTDAKVNPPLREESDRLALIEGLRDGTIDCIASDHAPHHRDDKNVEFDLAAFGISGLETSFALTYTQLVRENGFTLPALARLMSGSPAEILGLEGGEIAVGAAADLTVADLNKKWTVDPEMFLSKGKNTPFKGREVYGEVRYTFVDGKCKYGEQA